MTPPTTSPSATAAPTSWETLVQPGDLVFDVGAGDGTARPQIARRELAIAAASEQVAA